MAPGLQGEWPEVTHTPSPVQPSLFLFPEPTPPSSQLPGMLTHPTLPDVDWWQLYAASNLSYHVRVSGKQKGIGLCLPAQPLQRHQAQWKEHCGGNNE